jgi:hypothetical protein
LRERYPDSAPARQLEPTLEAVRKEAESCAKRVACADCGTTRRNAVGSGTQRSASIFSRTPTWARTAAAIPDRNWCCATIRNGARSAYLLLAQSKFSCGKPCALQLAFDEGELASWPGQAGRLRQGPALFIEDEKRFIEALRAAKQVRVVLPKGSGSIGTLVFEVGGFAAERYANPERESRARSAHSLRG